MSEEITEQSRGARFVSGLKRYGVMTGVAIAALFVALLPYIIRGKYLIWGGEQGDGTTQHATFLKYMFDKGLFRGAGGYDYNIGYGADYQVAFAYYMMFDPINLLMYLMPHLSFGLKYSLLECVRFILAALFMYIYLRKHGRGQTLSVMLATAYMLAGYSVFTFVRHPDLTSGAVYLPLVTLGIEQAVSRNKPFLLIPSVFVITVSSFYMVYMVTLYAVTYAVFYYLCELHKRGEKFEGRKFCAVFFRTAGYYLLGLLLASFLLLPVAYGYLTASRSGSKGFVLYTVQELFFLSGTFFVPVPGARYTYVMFNVCTLMLVFAAVVLTRKSAHRMLTLILAIGIFIPLMGYIMNLFNYASNRYTYMLNFSAYSLIAEFVSGRELERPTEKESNVMVKWLVAAIAVTLNLGVWTGVLWLIGKVHAALGALLALAAIGADVGSVIGIVKLFHRDYGTEKVRRRLSYRRLLTGLAAVTLGGALIFNVFYSAQFDDGSAFASLGSDAERYVAALDKDDFVRLDTTINIGQNRPLNSGYRGTVVYNTMAPAAVHDFLDANSAFTFSTTLGASGLNGRTALQAVLAARYYRAKEGEYVPAHYRAVEGVSELYETDDYVRFGTVFGKCMSTESFNALRAEERQYAYLDAVVTDSGEDVERAPLGEVYEGAELPEKFTLEKDKPHSFAVTQARGKELYLYFEIEDFPESNTQFWVSCGDVSLLANANRKGTQMYTGQKTFLFKLDENGTEIKFETEKGSPVVIKSLGMYAVDRDEILARVRSAAERPHLTDTKFADSGFTGTINSEGGYMLVPLAYSAGWKAYVDGVETDIERADAGLMSIEVGEGAHEIKFEYVTPWLSLGKIGSLAAAAATVAVVAAHVIIFLVKKKRGAESKEQA